LEAPVPRAARWTTEAGPARRNFAWPTAAYAVGTVLLARELGAALLTALVITGQLVCSVILDHFGWVGFTEHAAGIGRIAGCFLMVAGFILIARY
jgi:bacterial/archaeal transporter family-2 protein